MEESQRPIDESIPKSDYTMVLVELASVDEAIDAVANVHNSWPKKFGTMKKERFENKELKNIKRCRRLKRCESSAKLVQKLVTLISGVWFIPEFRNKLKWVRLIFMRDDNQLKNSYRITIYFYDSESRMHANQRQ